MGGGWHNRPFPGARHPHGNCACLAVCPTLHGPAQGASRMAGRHTYPFVSPSMALLQPPTRLRELAVPFFHHELVKQVGLVRCRSRFIHGPWQRQKLADTSAECSRAGPQYAMESLARMWDVTCRPVGCGRNTHLLLMRHIATDGGTAVVCVPQALVSAMDNPAHTDAVVALLAR